jgi:hypothetical protein
MNTAVALVIVVGITLLGILVPAVWIQRVEFMPVPESTHVGVEGGPLEKMDDGD